MLVKIVSEFLFGMNEDADNQVMPEGNACVAEPNLEVLPLIWFSKGPV